MPNLIQITAVVHPCGMKNRKSHFATCSFLWGEKIEKLTIFAKVRKFAILGGFLTGNPQIWADWGQIRQGVAGVADCYALPNLTPIGAIVCPHGAKKSF